MKRGVQNEDSSYNVAVAASSGAAVIVFRYRFDRWIDAGCSLELSTGPSELSEDRDIGRNRALGFDRP
jgi:hypothetical protein